MSPSTAWSEVVGKLGVPKSWQVDASAHSLHESVAAIYSDYKDKVEKPEGSELAHLKEVADASGKVGLRTRAGRTLMAMINKEAEEKRAYQQCKTHADMAAFRAKYAAKKYDKLVQTKYRKEFSFDLATVDAEYATFPRIVAREGGESADLVSFENAKAYVQSALAKWQSGETFHGHAWVKFDSMRNCAVVLHYREKVSSGTRREFGLMSERTQKPEEEPAASSASKRARVEGNECRRADNAQEEPKPDAQKDDAKKDVAKKDDAKKDDAKKDDAKKDDDKQDDDKKDDDEKDDAKKEDAKKEAKLLQKAVQQAVGKLLRLKADYSNAYAAASDLFEMIATEEVWSWARTDELLEGPRRARNALDAKKHESSFWKLWTADANFGTNVKKSFKPEEILVEAGEPYDAMKAHIAMLMQETQALKLMQEVRSKTKK